MYPTKIAAAAKIVLEYSGIREIRWADRKRVAVAIDVRDVNFRELIIPSQIDPNARGREELTGTGVGHLTNKSEALFPAQVWTKNGRVIEGYDLTSCVHRCREAKRGAIGE